MKNRVRACAKLLYELGFNSLLICDPINIAYLTGFNKGDGYLLLTCDGQLFYFTNFLYMEAAKKIRGWELAVSSFDRNIFHLIAEKAKKLNHKKVAFEAKKLPFLEYKTLNKLFSKKGVKFLEISDLIEKVRMIKDKNEISLIKKAVHITEEAFEFIGEIFDQNMTEKDLSIEVEKFLRLKGDNECAFSTIVACGKNTSFPHHIASFEKIGEKFFLIDLGSKYYEYCADLTRMFSWGKMFPLFKKIYSVIENAMDLSIKTIKDGVKASQVDKASRDYIDKKGLGKYFGHGVGHGIGLSVHECPMLGPNNDTILKEGMVITIEPAVYLPNKFGIRMEDMVLVKKSRGEVLSGHVD